MNYFLFYFSLLILLFDLPSSNSIKYVFEDLKGLDFDVSDFVKKHDLPVEFHTVRTDDGYILGLHRIPKPGGVPVLFHHGLFSDATCFLFVGNDSLPLLLAYEGYDVWLANYRGTIYSKGHVKYTWNDVEYWQWTWEEMGLYDIRAFVKYIYTLTNKKSINIGYSMGSTALGVTLASYPEMNEYMRGAFLMAPCIYMTHLTRIIRTLPSSLLGLVQKLYYASNSINFEIRLRNVLEMARKACSRSIEAATMCVVKPAQYSGDKRDYSNYTANENVVMSYRNYPRMSSFHTVLHYTQVLRSGEFQHYDWGIKRNLKKYGSVIPPHFDMRKTNVPTALIYTAHDTVSLPKDIDRLWNEIPEKCRYLRYQLPQEDLNHFAFAGGDYVKSLVYDTLVEIINEFVKATNS